MTPTHDIADENMTPGVRRYKRLMISMRRCSFSTPVSHRGVARRANERLGIVVVPDGCGRLAATACKAATASAVYPTFVTMSVQSDPPILSHRRRRQSVWPVAVTVSRCSRSERAAPGSR
jgi:hypothetical protein